MISIIAGFVSLQDVTESTGTVFFKRLAFLGTNSQQLNIKN
jgi:hypothetical protein